MPVPMANSIHFDSAAVSYRTVVDDRVIAWMRRRDWQRIDSHTSNLMFGWHRHHELYSSIQETAEICRQCEGFCQRIVSNWARSCRATHCPNTIRTICTAVVHEVQHDLWHRDRRSSFLKCENIWRKIEPNHPSIREPFVPGFRSGSVEWNLKWIFGFHCYLHSILTSLTPPGNVYGELFLLMKWQTLVCYPMIVMMTNRLPK